MATTPSVWLIQRLEARLQASNAPRNSADRRRRLQAGGTPLAEPDDAGLASSAAQPAGDLGSGVLPGPLARGY